MCKKLLFAILLGTLVAGVLSAPPHVFGVMACMKHSCDLHSGPVCAVDDEGLPRTFENRCMADLAYCRFGTYYAVVKPGEC